MASNKNWARWFFASITKYFSDELAATAPVYIEGQFQNTSLEDEIFEIRIDGPNYWEPSKDCWIFEVEINILIQKTMNDTNYHRFHQLVGIVASAFKDIEVLRKGNTDVEDDDTQLGCLQLMQSRRNRDVVEINHFGQVRPDINLMQATVEGHYRMIIRV